MTVHDPGLNRLRDLVNTDLYSVVYGTDGSAIVVTDTALGGQTDEDTGFTAETSDKKILITSTLTSAEGNGNDFKESGIKINSGSTLFSRALNAPISKNNTIELVRISDITFDR